MIILSILNSVIHFFLNTNKGCPPDLILITDISPISAEKRAPNYAPACALNLRYKQSISLQHFYPAPAAPGSSMQGPHNHNSRLNFSCFLLLLDWHVYFEIQAVDSKLWAVGQRAILWGNLFIYLFIFIFFFGGGQSSVVPIIYWQ